MKEKDRVKVLRRIQSGGLPYEPHFGMKEKDRVKVVRRIQ